MAQMKHARLLLTLCGLLPMLAAGLAGCGRPADAQQGGGHGPGGAGGAPPAMPVAVVVARVTNVPVVIESLPP